MSYVMLWYRKLVEGYVGTLYDYVARAYDPVLGRFISADTIVPWAGNSQGFNRYMYVLGNPLLRIDPSGHDPFISLDVFRARLYAMQSELHTNPFYGELGVKADTGKLYRDYGSPVGALGLDEFREDNGFFMAAAAEKVSNVMLYQGCEYCLPTSELEGFGRRVGEADGNNMASYNPGSLLMFASSLRAAEQGGCSFSPDTLVATDAGYVPIAGVITGTRVLAWDEMANATGYYPVTNVWTHWDPILVVLIIDGETITTTPEHPFYTPMHGWLPAGELWVGAGLRTASGGTMVVDSTSLTFHPSQMRNLSVDGAHTYFVGQSKTLVHNTCDDGGVIGRNMMSRLPNELLDPPEVRGKAPRFRSDGSPVEIHHVDQNPAGPFVEMHWDDHRGAGNFAENHPGSQSPINRTQFDQQKKQYWRFEWDRGRWSPEEK